MPGEIIYLIPVLLALWVAFGFYIVKKEIKIAVGPLYRSRRSMRRIKGLRERHG